VTETPEPKRDLVGYSLSIIFGIVAGWLEIKVGDLLLTAIVVMIFTMFLGVMWPRKPWRWSLLVATCVPVLRVFSSFVLGEHTSRAQVIESFQGFLTGTVGVYAGASLRRVLQVFSSPR
jgi:ABC-type multidrug transport system permease subunit